MPIRMRKFVGTIVLMIFIPLYCLFAAALGDVALQKASGIVQAVYFVVAGLLWVLPAGLIVTWMVKPRPGETVRNQSSIGR